MAALACSPICWAKPSDQTEREVVHLLDFVATPGCQFNRNGSWFDGATARTHLRKKYDYLVGRSMVTTAETFVEQAASKSSMTGQPYLVRCGTGKPVESGPWLLQELHRYRK